MPGPETVTYAVPTVIVGEPLYMTAMAPEAADDAENPPGETPGPRDIAQIYTAYTQMHT